MLKTPNALTLLVAETIARALQALGHDGILTLDQISENLTTPPQLDLGHSAFPCFLLAKALRKGPPQIAAALAAAITPPPGIATVKQEGPYCNFTFSLSALGEQVVEPCLNRRLFSGAALKNTERMMIEYSQPNTHKELHVGHMRNLCLGNALVRLNRYAGIETIAVTYPGDVGTHVAKCLWYLHERYQGAWPTQDRGQWLGKIYQEATTALDAVKGSPEEAPVAARLTAILNELHHKSGPYYELWRETRQWSLDLMQKAYDWADVRFDRWFFESEVDEPSLRYMHELFAEHRLVKDQGAIGMNLEAHNLGFCLLVKSDGTGLYATKDIELARRKFEEFGIEKNIYVVDNRQAHHFKQVFQVLENLGFPQAKDCFHLQYEMVELPDGAMSSRKGNIVPLMTLIAEMEAAIIRKHLAKYRGTWSDAEINTSATMIANGAIKYGMLRVDNNRKIVFNLDEWVDLDGETGPYLQYVHARIFSLEEKCGPLNQDLILWQDLSTPQELALMLHLNQFCRIVGAAAAQLKTITLCAYLYDLAKAFNAFYNACPIMRAETEALKHGRLALAKAVRLTMKEGLGILGIPAPDRM